MGTKNQKQKRSPNEVYNRCQGGLTMMKFALVVAAAVLTTAPLATPAKAQGVKMAQVDMQTGLHIDDCACRKSNPNILVVQPAQDRRQRMVPASLTARETGASFSK